MFTSKFSALVRKFYNPSTGFDREPIRAPASDPVGPWWPFPYVDRLFTAAKISGLSIPCVDWGFSRRCIRWGVFCTAPCQHMTNLVVSLFAFRTGQEFALLCIL